MQHRGYHRRDRGTRYQPWSPYLSTLWPAFIVSSRNASACTLPVGYGFFISNGPLGTARPEESTLNPASPFPRSGKDGSFFTSTLYDGPGRFGSPSGL